jgi:hypothetical protein
MPEEYVEPSNEQLAKFLVVYAKQFPGLEILQVDAPTLEWMLDHNSKYREASLRHHRRFQEKIIELTRKMKAGELQCAHIRHNGRPCPNSNEPGSYYCGLHKDEEI